MEFVHAARSLRWTDPKANKDLATTPPDATEDRQQAADRQRASQVTGPAHTLMFDEVAFTVRRTLRRRGPWVSRVLLEPPDVDCRALTGDIAFVASDRSRLWVRSGQSGRIPPAVAGSARIRTDSWIGAQDVGVRRVAVRLRLLPAGVVAERRGEQAEQDADLERTGLPVRHDRGTVGSFVCRSTASAAYPPNTAVRVGDVSVPASMATSRAASLRSPCTTVR